MNISPGHTDPPLAVFKFPASSWWTSPDGTLVLRKSSTYTERRTHIHVRSVTLTYRVTLFTPTLLHGNTL